MTDLMIEPSTTLERLKKISDKKRADGTHILDGGGKWGRVEDDGYSTFRVPRRYLDEFARETRRNFRIINKNGMYEVAK